MSRPRPAPRAAAAAALGVLGLAGPALAGCGAAPPVAGALPPAPSPTRAAPTSSAVAGTAADHAGATSPNPPVGCVLLDASGDIIAVEAHRTGKGGAKYTKSHGRDAVRLAYAEKCADKSAALKREAALK